MFSKLLKLATAGTVAVIAGYSVSASADDFLQNLGPVGPHEPILTAVGNKRIIAFYVADGSRCGMNIVMWDRDDPDDGSPARVRVSLDPRQIVHIDSSQNSEVKSLNLQCGEYADSLAIVETNGFITVGAAQ